MRDSRGVFRSLHAKLLSLGVKPASLMMLLIAVVSALVVTILYPVFSFALYFHIIVGAVGFLGILTLNDWLRTATVILLIGALILELLMALGNGIHLLPMALVVLPFRFLRQHEVAEHFSAPAIGRIPTSKQVQRRTLFKKFGAHLFLIVAVIVTVFPVAWVFGTSVKPGNQIVDTELEIIPPLSEWTGEHYTDIFSQNNEYINFYGINMADIWVFFLNSLLVAAGTTLLGLVLATTAAYGFSRFEFRGKGSAMLSFLIVQMFPGVLIIVPYFILLKSLGLLNHYLGLILAYSVTALPLCVWQIKGFFDTIPRELEEAAFVDGCNQFQAFYKIILPLAKPAIAVTALFSFLAAWNEYLLAYTFMLKENYYTLPVRIYQFVGGSSVKWGSFAAMSIIVSIPVVILFIVFQKYLISGMTAGGVKG